MIYSIVSYSFIFFSAQNAYRTFVIRGKIYKYNGAPTIEAYSASNNVQVTTKMLDKLSDIIDRSTAAGANQIGGVSFSLSREKQKELQEELLAEAVSDASSKANDLARKLDVRIAGLKTSSISEVGIMQPFLREVSIPEGKAATPIMPGETKVSLQIGHKSGDLP